MSIFFGNLLDFSTSQMEFQKWFSMKCKYIYNRPNHLKISEIVKHGKLICLYFENKIKPVSLGNEIHLKSQKVEQIVQKFDIFLKNPNLLYTREDMFFRFFFGRTFKSYHKDVSK